MPGWGGSRGEGPSEVSPEERVGASRSHVTGSAPDKVGTCEGHKKPSGECWKGNIRPAKDLDVSAWSIRSLNPPAVEAVHRVRLS